MGVYFLCICYFVKFGMVKIERNIGYFDLFDWFFLKIVSCKLELLIFKVVGWLFFEMFDNNKVYVV